MTVESAVSRNSIGLDSRSSKFRGRRGRRLARWTPLGLVMIFSILSACGEKAQDDEASLGGEAPRRLSGVTPAGVSEDEVFLQETVAATRGPAAAPEGRWSLLLASVGGANHPIQAAGTRNEIAARYPQLRTAFVRPQGKGSAIWFGRFSSPSDPAAVQAREMVAGLVENGRRVFPKAFLSVLPDDSPIGERDLRNLRLMYPGVDPLYTLQVGCWGTFNTDRITFDEVKRRAEARVEELRRAGHDAWYYHDSLTKMSVITVGVFDRRAYDSRSTLFSPEVEMLMAQFPVHRINGEDVMVQIDPDDRSTQVPQACRLVSVPELP